MNVKQRLDLMSRGREPKEIGFFFAVVAFEDFLVGWMAAGAGGMGVSMACEGGDGVIDGIAMFGWGVGCCSSTHSSP
jgi:hypothetical protein